MMYELVSVGFELTYGVEKYYVQYKHGNWYIFKLPDMNKMIWSLYTHGDSSPIISEAEIALTQYLGNF